MRGPVALIVVVATAALFVHPASGLAQGWSSVTVNNQRPVVGNGQVVTQSRPIGNFREIESRGASDVIVRVGARPSLSITAESNIIPLLSSDIRGDKLVLDTRGSYRTRHSPRIVITVPALEGAGLSGSGNIRVDGVDGRAFAMAINGSGNLVAAGRTGRLAVAINGSGNADARALPAASAQVAIHGSGNATVRTGGVLAGAIAGSGNIRHVGRPASIQVIRNGSGTVVPAR